MVVNVIGAGLAGCEASYYLANHGVKVNLYEMKPVKRTPASKSDLFAELVCSNSLRGASIENAVGLLKEEMRRLGSIVMESALNNSVEAGGALAVDRELFSKYITDKIKSHPNIKIINEEVIKIPSGPTIIATGPLTSDEFSKAIAEFVGKDYLYFFDAVAPIVTSESINKDIAYLKSRYDKGEPSYYNCPMTEEQFGKFYNELILAERVKSKDFEMKVFEGCMAIEDMADRGRRTLLFGPMKPIGLRYPGSMKTPYAVVQLRQDNTSKTLYNIVGFQTHLKWGEQDRVFRLIPGLENAEFVRYGVMHRNSYMDSPNLLKQTFQSKSNPNLFFAGQMTGVEGYVESAASGLVAGINAARLFKGEDEVIFPHTTAIGSLPYYVTHAESKHFQPMNVNFGIIKELEGPRIRDKKERYEKIAERALKDLQPFIQA